MTGLVTGLVTGLMTDLVTGLVTELVTEIHFNLLKRKTGKIALFGITMILN